MKDNRGHYDYEEFKRHRPMPWFAIIIAMLCLFWTFCCHAQVTTYQYTGAACASCGDTLAGFIELAQPLAPNSTVSITPDNQGFDESSDSLMAEPEIGFTLTTDANGNIVEWNFSGGIYVACSCDLNFVSTNAGDTWTSSKFYFPTGQTISAIVGTSGPGKWTTIAGPPTMAMAPQLSASQSALATSEQQFTSVANGYAAANGIIAELNPALLAAKNGEISIARGYMSANATIAALNAALVAEKQLVALCRANKGVC
jgi:hypothetical protein